MKFTQEDIETTMDEIAHYLSCIKVNHVRDSQFVIIAKFWTADNFARARELGLDVTGVMPKYLGKDNSLGYEIDRWGIEVEVDYIGENKVVLA